MEKIEKNIRVLLFKRIRNTCTTEFSSRSVSPLVAWSVCFSIERPFRLVVGFSDEVIGFFN
jgi:hypothetical protein